MTPILRTPIRGLEHKLFRGYQRDGAGVHDMNDATKTPSGGSECRNIWTVGVYRKTNMKFDDISDRAEAPGWWKRVAERWVSLDYEYGFHLVCGTWFTCRGESLSLQLQGGGFTDSERSYFVGINTRF
jgi:hypothetical protein